MSQSTGDPVAKISAPANPQTSPDLEDDFEEPTTTSSPKKDATPPTSGGSSKAEDILAMIRNRNK
jgi:hypothetical protein